MKALLLFLTIPVVGSDRVIREKVGQTVPSSIAASSGASTTTTLEKTSTGDATFFIPPSGSTTQQGVFSFDSNNPLTVSTRSIDGNGGMYGASLGGFGGYSPFVEAAPSPFAAPGNPFMGGFGGSPIYGGGATPIVMGGTSPGGMFGGADPSSMMNPMALYQQMIYYRQMAQFLLGARSGGSYAAPAPSPFPASPFPYARYILRDKLKTTMKD
ncbi:hypothetical protein PMAYCL1PPCAC_29944 [Pristionchus mayeri]|uniref:Uncharacterized protein n=1 Tax=Pristionchus mayeri TaxID=1317129 RepID=A0AAN5DB04_9BILA|nr:hypothetical protein PMAYCL1PPCAC_29944 [Pristionchus mayeri]